MRRNVPKRLYFFQRSRSSHLFAFWVGARSFRRTESGTLGREADFDHPVSEWKLALKGQEKTAIPFPKTAVDYGNYTTPWEKDYCAQFSAPWFKPQQRCDHLPAVQKGLSLVFARSATSVGLRFKSSCPVCMYVCVCNRFGLDSAWATAGGSCICLLVFWRKDHVFAVFDQKWTSLKSIIP